MILTHLRRNVVAYLALLVAVTTGTAYAAVSIPNGSVTTKKLHANAVTTSKIRNKTIKNRDIKRPTWVQSQTLVGETPPTNPDLVSIAPYDFTLPTKGRVSITVFVPTIGALCDGTSSAAFTGLYIDNVAIPATRANVPAPVNDRSIQLTATLPLAAGAHAARFGVTCPGGPVPTNINDPGAKSWHVVLTG
jgi:hypothetical protein